MSIAVLVLICSPAICFAQVPAVKYVPGISDFAGMPPVAGVAQSGYTGDGGPAAAAKLNSPFAVTFDSVGNLYIADGNNYVVRKIDANGIITTVVGNGTSTPVCVDDPVNPPLATSCAIGKPFGVALDPSGNIFVSDPAANIVRKVDAATGRITRYAGNGTTGGTGDGGDALLAGVRYPTDLHCDSVGNLYITNQQGNKIHRVDAGLVNGYHRIVRYAGSGSGGYLDATPADTAKVNNPYGFAFDSAKNMYIADTKNYVIRKVDSAGPAGSMTTVVGTALTAGTIPAVNNLSPLNTKLVYAQRVFVDPAGNLYIADSSDAAIRMVDKNFQLVTLFAGVQAIGYSSNGAALASQLRSPFGMDMDKAGNLYVADGNNALVRKIGFNNQFSSLDVAAPGVTSGIYTQVSPTLAQALAIQSFGTVQGFPDFTTGALASWNPTTNTATVCSLDAASPNPAGTICTAPVTFAPTAPGLRSAPVVLMDGNNVKYVTSVYGIGRAPALAVTPGTITTLAGNSAELSSPAAVAVDMAGNIYIADTANHAIRKIVAGVMTTIAGNGTPGFLGDDGPAVNSQVNAPAGIAVDASGNVYIADSGNNRVRMISAATGYITTVAGNGVAGATGDGATAITAKLNNPTGLAVDTVGNLYIADTANNEARLVTAADGFINTIAGTGTAGYTGDNGAATAAELNGPTGIVLDNNGQLFIADTSNGAVRKLILKTGIISTTTNSGTAPAGVAVDAAGDVYFTDSASNQVKMVSAADASVIVVAGNGTAGLSGDGSGSLAAMLKQPSGLALDGQGQLYIADTGNNRLRLVSATAPTLDFGTLAVGSTSASQTLRVRNIGNQTLALTGRSVASNFTQGTSASECSGTTVLAPGQGCDITITFTPGVGGSINGAVVLTDNALNATGTQQTFALKGEGVEHVSGLAVSGLGANSTAGQTQTITVTAMDGATTVTSYVGTVHFTSSDPQSVLPSDYTFTIADNGTRAFTNGVTFKTAGSYKVTATDVSASVSGDSETTVVVAAAANKVTAEAGGNQTVAPGTALPIALQAKVTDAYGNVVAGDTVTFTAVSGTTGANGTFAPAASATATATTGADGIATAPVLTANSNGGDFTVTATDGAATAASFAEHISSKPAVAVVASVIPSGPVAYGSGSVVLKTTLDHADATGTIIFSENGVHIGSPIPVTVTGGVAGASASLPVDALTTAVHIYRADYSGDASHAAGYGEVFFIVNKATSTLVAPATVDVTAGQSQDVTVTVAGQFSGTGISSPSGTVSYSIDGGADQTSAIVSGKAIVTIPSSLSGGNHAIVVKYVGDSNYQPANQITIAVKVNQQSQTTTFAPIANHIYGDAPFSLSATASSGLAVTFKVTLGPASISGNTLTILGGGNVTVEADQAGNQIYSGAAPVQQTFRVDKAGTTTVLTTSSASVMRGDPVTFTATVSSSVSGTPTGSVSFYDGTTLLGTASLTSGVAKYSYTSTPQTVVGPHSTTAVYGSDTNFAQSTSAAVTQTITLPDFSFTSSTQALTVVNGAAGVLTLNITPDAKFAGPITFTCSNLPVRTTCVFTPNPLTVTAGTAPAPVPLAIQTTPANGLLAEMRGPMSPVSYLPVMPAAVFILPGGLMGSLAALGRRRMTAKAKRALLVIALIALVIGLASCGGSSAKTVSSSPAGTPSGTSTVTVTLSYVSGETSISHSSNITLTVQ